MTLANQNQKCREKRIHYTYELKNYIFFFIILKVMTIKIYKYSENFPICNVH